MYAYCTNKTRKMMKVVRFQNIEFLERFRRLSERVKIALTSGVKIYTFLLRVDELTDLECLVIIITLIKEKPQRCSRLCCVLRSTALEW